MVVPSRINQCPKKSPLILAESSSNLCWHLIDRLCEVTYTEDFCGGQDDLCSGVEVVIEQERAARRVTFAPVLVSDVKLRPRIGREEKTNLHYTDIDIQRFRQEARLERMRTGSSILYSI